MYMFIKTVLVSIFSLMLGCTSDYKINPDIEPNEPGVTSPEIEAVSYTHLRAHET